MNCIGTKSDVSSIKGIVHMVDGVPVEPPDRFMIEDLDALPFPSRRLLAGRKYRYPDALRTPAFPIITNRGCPGIGFF